jgi:DNA-binding NarL/FixJ family response regulator
MNGPTSGTTHDFAILDGLTAREREVLSLIDEHLTNRQIADTLSIAEGTVETHVHSILQKLDVSSRGEAARLYRRAQTARFASNVPYENPGPS